MRLGEWRPENKARNERNAHHFYYAFWSITARFTEQKVPPPGEGGAYALIVTSSTWWRKDEFARKRAKIHASVAAEQNRRTMIRLPAFEIPQECAPKDYETTVEVPF